MSVDLPDGCSWRRATRADAETILPLIVAHNTAVVGFPDCTLDDLRDQLDEPSLDLETGTWLVQTTGGTVTGYAWASSRGDGELIDIDVTALHPDVAQWLFVRVLARAEELAHSGGHHRVTVDQGIYRTDATLRELAAAHGFRPATTFHRMRADHGCPVPDPVAPAGVILRTGPGDERFRRTAHALLTESFKDHFGWIPQPFEDWHEARERESTFDWSQLTLAELDFRPVAILLTGNHFAVDENCGYVSVLGVLAETRGRGIAKYLLRIAFAADSNAGRAGTILHVDTNNTTPALGLYESVGMRPVLEIDVWRRIT